MTYTERWTLRNCNKTAASDLLPVPLPGNGKSVSSHASPQLKQT